MTSILVVDDIAANRKLLCQMLHALGGYDVLEADSGISAIEMFATRKPDLVLMDIGMPGMDGIEAASRIKALDDDGHTPIIFVTALSEGASLARALEAGGDDFLSKPFDVDVLAARIRAHLRIRELTCRLRESNRALREHNERLCREQELIEHFFTSALTQSDMDESYIRFHMSPLSVFSGDLLLVERGPCGGLYLVTGDFTGHGLTAAMGTLPVASIFFRLARQGVSLGDMARELNDQLHRLLPPGIFLAATLLELNPRGDRLSVWQGGMPETCWLSAQGHVRGHIASRHMPLGILADGEFDDTVEVFYVQPGDRLYLYTDGLIESRDPGGRMFGASRVRTALAKHGSDRFDQLLAAFRDFVAQQGQADDITLVELTCRAIPARGAAGAQDLPAWPWRFTLSLSADALRTGAPVVHLADLLAAIPGLTRHRGILEMILGEMYSNAVDHGVLGLASTGKTGDRAFADYYARRECRLAALESARVAFSLEFRPGEPAAALYLRVTHDGTAYCTKHAGAPDGDALHGRGLAILQGLCERVSFSPDGRTLEVCYRP